MHMHIYGHAYWWPQKTYLLVIAATCNAHTHIHACKLVVAKGPFIMSSNHLQCVFVHRRWCTLTQPFCPKWGFSSPAKYLAVSYMGEPMVFIRGSIEDNLFYGLLAIYRDGVNVQNLILIAFVFLPAKPVFLSNLHRPFSTLPVGSVFTAWRGVSHGELFKSDLKGKFKDWGWHSLNEHDIVWKIKRQTLPFWRKNGEKLQSGSTSPV